MAIGWSPYSRPKRPVRPASAASGPRPTVAAWLLAAVVALSVVGYPVAGIVGTIIGVESWLASATFRVLVDLIAVAGVYLVILNREKVRLDLVVVAFLVLYLARLVWDSQRLEFADVTTDTAFYVASALIPAIAVGLIAVHWNDQLVARLTFFVGLTAAGMVMFMELTGFYAIATLTEERGRLTLEAVNPITLGQLGASVLLSAMVLWKRSELWFRLTLLVGMGVGAWVIVEANSRSPFLSLAAAGVTYMIAKAQWHRLAMLIGGGVVAVAGSNLLDRLQGSRLITISDESSRGRFFVQRSALNDFVNHPFFGSGYLDSYGFAYPHNIWLESAMALGIGGFTLLGIATVAAVGRTFQAYRGDNVMMGLLFWQSLMLAAVSTPLFAAGVVFILMMAMTRLYPFAFVTHKPPLGRLDAARPLGRPQADEVRV